MLMRGKEAFKILSRVCAVVGFFFVAKAGFYVAKLEKILIVYQRMWEQMEEVVAGQSKKTVSDIYYQHLNELEQLSGIVDPANMGYYLLAFFGAISLSIIFKRAAIAESMSDSSGGET